MQMKSYTYAIIGSLSFAAVGMLGTNVSHAAQLTGTFGIAGGTVSATSFGTLADFGLPDDGPLTPNTPFTSFEVQPISGAPGVTVPNEGNFLISTGTGDFAGFDPLPSQSGIIKNLLTPGDFISLAGGTPIDNWLVFSQESGFDGSFTLLSTSSASYTLDGTSGVTISFAVTGVFDLAGFDTTFANGNLGAEFQFANIPGVNNFDDFIAFVSTPNNRIEQGTWSANFTMDHGQPVPESSPVSALIGLGLMGSVFTIKRKLSTLG